MTTQIFVQFSYQIVDFYQFKIGFQLLIVRMFYCKTLEPDNLLKAGKTTSKVACFKNNFSQLCMQGCASNESNA